MGTKIPQCVKHAFKAPNGSIRKEVRNLYAFLLRALSFPVEAKGCVNVFCTEVNPRLSFFIICGNMPFGIN